MPRQRCRFTGAVSAVSFLLLLASSTVLHAQPIASTPGVVIFGSSTVPQNTQIVIQNPSTTTAFAFSAIYRAAPVVGSALPAANVFFVGTSTILIPASIDPSSIIGTIPPAGSTTIPMQVNPMGLPTGVYSGQLLISPQTSIAGTQMTLPLIVYIGPHTGEDAPTGGGLGLMLPVNLPPVGSGIFQFTSPGDPTAGAYPIILSVAAPSNISTSNPAPTPIPIVVGGLNNTVSSAYAVNPPSTILAGVSFSNAGQGPGGPLSTCSPTYAQLSNLPGSPPGPSCIWNIWIDPVAVSSLNLANLGACGGNPGETGTIIFNPSGYPFSPLTVPVTVCLTDSPTFSVQQAALFPSSIFGPNAPLPLPANLSANFPLSLVDSPIPAAGITLLAQTGGISQPCQVLNIHSNGGAVPDVQILPITVPWLTIMQAPVQFLGLIPSFSNPGTVSGLTPLPGGPATIGSGMQTFQLCANSAVLPNVPGIFNTSVTIQDDGGNSTTIPVTLVVHSFSGSPVPTQLAVFRNTTVGPNAGLGQWWFSGPSNALDASTKGPRWFGLNGDIPVAGDWDGSGVTRIGVFRCPAFGVCQWYIDLNNNGQWDGIAGGDAIWSFGLPGDQPVVGDWTGSGVTKLGVMRCPPAVNPGVCTWFLDLGNKHTYDPVTVGTYSFGLTGDKAIAGPFSHTVIPVDNIGVFRCPTLGGCQWFVDSVGQTNLSTTIPASVAATSIFDYGLSGDQPVIGVWNNAGGKRIGIFRIVNGPGIWIVDTNGNYSFDPTIDQTFHFGTIGDQALTGVWTLP